MSGDKAVIIILAIWCGILSIGLFYLQWIVNQMKIDIDHNFRKTKAEIHLLKQEKQSHIESWENQIRDILTKKRV